MVVREHRRVKLKANLADYCKYEGLLGNIGRSGVWVGGPDLGMSFGGGYTICAYKYGEREGGRESWGRVRCRPRCDCRNYIAEQEGVEMLLRIMVGNFYGTKDGYVGGYCPLTVEAVFSLLKIKKRTAMIFHATQIQVKL